MFANDTNYSFSRKEGNVAGSLTEAKRARRKRETSVNIEIMFISWVVELLTGWLMMIVRLSATHLGYGHNTTLTSWTWFTDYCLVFVIIPCTHIINNGSTKEIIISENWYAGIQSLLPWLNKSAQSTPPQNPVADPAHQNNSNQPSGARGTLRERRHADALELEDIEEGEASDTAEE